MNLQGNEVENYQLHHYTGDEFSWLMTRNEQIKRVEILLDMLSIGQFALYLRMGTMSQDYSGSSRKTCLVKAWSSRKSVTSIIPSFKMLKISTLRIAVCRQYLWSYARIVHDKYTNSLSTGREIVVLSF
jgi:hypothetical protein